VVAIRQLGSPTLPPLYHHGAGVDEFLHRAINAVHRAPQPPRQRRPRGHPGARGLAVAQQDGAQPERGVGDLGVDDPLRDDGEPFLDDEVAHEGLDCEQIGNAAASTDLHGLTPAVRPQPT
jgi:hypothetical protein